MNKKLLIIIIAAVVVLGAAAFLLLPKLLGGGGEAQVAVDKPLELTYYVPGEYFVTNVAESDKLLKATVSLGFETEGFDAAAMKLRNDELRDVINRELRTLTEEDIADPNILDNLKDDLLAALTDTLSLETLHDIKFSDFVTQ